MENLEWTGLDFFFRGGNFFGGEGGWGCIIFSSLKKNRVSNLSPTGYIFSFVEGGGKDFIFLLVCVLVLDWSLCLTHGRHVSLES